MGLPFFEPRLDTDLMRPYWDAIRNNDLRLPACSVCGAWLWYPPESLPCHPNGHLEWRPVPKTGTVYTFTTVERCLLPGDHKDDTPYTNALVELDNVPGVRLVTILINLNGTPPKIGMRVRYAPTKVNDQTLPTFEPET